MAELNGRAIWHFDSPRSARLRGGPGRNEGKNKFKINCWLDGGCPRSPGKVEAKKTLIMNTEPNQSLECSNQTALRSYGQPTAAADKISLRPEPRSFDPGAGAVQPWFEPVDGKALLDGLVQVLQRFAVLPKWAAETLALWIVHTFAFQLRDVTTYIGIESPEKRCGKTTVLGLLKELANRAVASSNISPPAFFRV